MYAILQLLRLPTLFTAMADIFLGYVLTHRVLDPWPEFVGLLLASSGLYLAGMVFNDIFDRVQDAAKHPIVRFLPDESRCGRRFCSASD